MFSSAVSQLKDEGAYRVLAAANALERQGKKVVHLEIGQPAFPTPPWVAEAGCEAIKQGFTTYTNPSGIVELKQAIARHVSKTRSVAVTEANVVVGPGAKPGLWFAVQAIVSAGDEVLIPDPGFPMYANMIKVFGGVPVCYDALGDFAQLKSLVTPNTKCIILNSPSNPTGRVLSMDELKVVAACIGPAMWVVSDEIYTHLTYDEDEAEDHGASAGQEEFSTTPSIASLPDMLKRTIICDGFSKTFSMTGWRLGFVVCPPDLAQRLHLLMTHAVGCTASFTQRAGLAALTSDQRVANVRAMVAEYRTRRDFVVARLNAMPGVKCAVPRGAFYAFADVSGVGVSARELCDKCLNEGLVAILPGGDFGPRGEDFIRISYVGDMAVLTEGLHRMEGVVAGVAASSGQKKKLKM
jgi:aspartate aminotransferase